MKNAAMAARNANDYPAACQIQPLYLETQTLVERLHRRLLDVIEDELHRRNQFAINAVQALLIYNVGDRELSASELRSRGCYLGSNVSYNIKKLVELGFLNHQRSRVDRRGVRIKLTAAGHDVCNIVAQLYRKHADTVEQVGDMNAQEIVSLNRSLQRLERFWVDQVMYRL